MNKPQLVYIPVLILRLTVFKVAMTILCLVAAINHIIWAIKPGGVPEPSAEHWLFGLVICPLMASVVYMNRQFIMRSNIIKVFVLAQIVEHMGWILWLGNNATIAQTIQNIVAITFAILYYLAEQLGFMD